MLPVLTECLKMKFLSEVEVTKDQESQKAWNFVLYRPAPQNFFLLELSVPAAVLFRLEGTGSFSSLSESLLESMTSDDDDRK